VSTDWSTPTPSRGGGSGGSGGSSGGRRPPARPTSSKPPSWWKRHRVAKKRRLAAMTRKRRIWRRVGLIATWCLGGLAVFLVVAVVALYTLADVPRPEDLPQPQAGEIFYADGTPMAKIGTENRTNVPLSQVPLSMRWAVISTEDRNFYNDPGFSFTGTARAALSDLTGGDTQGGSGITQQYVKNAYLSSAQTITRKIKELAISVKLAREYSKDDILEFYLNTVYFGRGAYGIEAAAQTWFNEDVSKLTVAQSALLAGLLKAPSGYDPALHPVAAHARWKLVLDNMVTTKHLTGEEEAALTYPATQPVTDGNGLGASGPENLIVNQVTQELEADGMSESEINTKGLRITTTIVPAAQQDAEKAIATAYANPTAKQANLHQALVAVDPSSGAVIAYYGNSDGNGIDYAQAYRQPGSSFKPYVLATALQQNLDGIKPAYTIDSVFDGSSPQIIDGQSISNDPTDPKTGKYTLSQAMTLSLNTVFYRLASDVKPGAVATMAHSLGIAATGDVDGNGVVAPTLAINGVTDDRIGIGGYEVRPIDQAVGYATLADGGIANSSFFVQKVTDAKGNVLYQHRATGKRVIDPKIANDTTLSMEKVASTSSIGLAGGRAVAAKTGTVGIGTTLNSGDAWTVGFTPSVSVASWAGANNPNDPIYNNQGTSMYGRQNPGQAWQLFMNAYLGSSPKQALPTKQQIGAATPTPTPTPTTDTPTPTSSAPTSNPPTTPTPPTTPPSTPPSIPPVSLTPTPS
jgi:membrane peptidoglycan carboxypeptidase